MTCLSLSRPDRSAGGEHQDYHPSWLVKGPEEAHAFRCMLEQVHPDSLCDNCDVFPLGTRYRCLDCDDFDLCSLCFKNPVVLRAHNNVHAFYPLRRPDNIGAYETYKAERALNIADRQQLCCETCDNVLPRPKCPNCIAYNPEE